MAYAKKTLRHMSPQARKLARLINELESTTRRLKNFMPSIQDIELDSRALQHSRGKPKLGLSELDSGKEIFPGDIALAVRPSEHDKTEGSTT